MNRIGISLSMLAVASLALAGDGASPGKGKELFTGVGNLLERFRFIDAQVVEQDIHLREAFNQFRDHGNIGQVTRKLFQRCFGKFFADFFLGYDDRCLGTS